MQKRILVISEDEMLRRSRSLLLLATGYAVSTAESGDDALDLMRRGNTFDLLLIGSNLPTPMPLDQQLRDALPNQLILRIAEREPEVSPCTHVTVDANPNTVLETIHRLLHGT